jgi:prolyl-tRNA synthetase
MKDLYTFDASEEQAEATYNEVKEAYVRIFDQLKVPYLVVSLRKSGFFRWTILIFLG